MEHTHTEITLRPHCVCFQYLFVSVCVGGLIDKVHIFGEQKINAKKLLNEYYNFDVGKTCSESLSSLLLILNGFRYTSIVALPRK